MPAPASRWGRLDRGHPSLFSRRSFSDAPLLLRARGAPRPGRAESYHHAHHGKDHPDHDQEDLVPPEAGAADPQRVREGAEQRRGEPYHDDHQSCLPRGYGAEPTRPAAGVPKGALFPLTRVGSARPRRFARYWGRRCRRRTSRSFGLWRRASSTASTSGRSSSTTRRSNGTRPPAVYHGHEGVT